MRTLGWLRMCPAYCFGTRRSSCWRHGEGLYEDDKVSPWTGAGRLPQFRTLASQFLLGQAFTSDPRSWRISSRTLKNVRAPRFWMVWEKLWKSQSTSRGELMSDESCRGDFIGDDDFIPLAHRKAKIDCQEYLVLWVDSTSVYAEWEGGLSWMPQPTDGLAGRTR